MADSQGWIQLHRSLREWEWFTDVNTSHLFIYCLLRANHKDTKWRGQDICRGSFITSLETMSKETGLSVMQIRTAIKKLELTNELTSKSSSKNRLITITNYNKYQDDNRQDNKQLTSKQQTDNKQVTTDNNDNNNKNNDNKYIVQFEEFWELYGIKKGRAKCEAKYKLLMRDKFSHEQILDGVRAYQAECEKNGTEREFIKNPLTFLNGKHWEDEYERELTREEREQEILRNIGGLQCKLINS